MKKGIFVSLGSLIILGQCARGELRLEQWHAELLSETKVVVSVLLTGATGVECSVTFLMDQTDRGTNATTWGTVKDVGTTTSNSLTCAVDMQIPCTGCVCRVVVREDGEEVWSEVSVLQAANKGFSKVQVVAMEEADRQREYAQAKASGRGPEELLGVYQIVVERKLPPTTWNEWMTNYHGTILDPPVEFDMATPVSGDRSNTINMVKWYWHQVWRRDTNALMAVATQAGKQEVSGFGLNIRLANGVETNAWSLYRDGSCTKVKILCGGYYDFDNMTLICILTRRQHPTEPLHHKVFIDPVVFFKSGGLLWIGGQDVGAGLPCGATEKGGYKDWEGTFDELEEWRHTSDMPAHFFLP